MNVLKNIGLSAPFILVLAGFLLIAIARGPSIREMSGAEYLRRLCAVNIGFQSRLETGRSSEYDGVMPKYDGRYFYALQYQHSQDLLAVPEADVLDLSGPFIAKLTNPDFSVPKKKSLTQKYKTCLKIWKNQPEDFAAFIDQVVEKRGIASEDEISYFKKRVDSHDRRALTYIFEFVILTGWLIFTMWPFMFRRHRYRWALHIGFSYFVLSIPYLLGYGGPIFSTAPNSGIFYPFLLMLVSIPALALRDFIVVFQPVDRFLYDLSPFILDYFSQSPGTYVSASSMGGFSPTFALLIGVIMLPFYFLSRRRKRAGDSTAT